jgi:hypothetical protein
MNSLDTLTYKIGLSNTFKLELIHNLEDYFIRVSSRDRPAASIGEPIRVLTKYSYSERCVTPPYKTKNEAYAYACGWIDCNFYNPTNSDKNEESWEENYTKFKEIFEEFYKVILSSVAKQEYKKGWDKNLNDRFSDE